MAKLLVTGSSGFIGSALVRRLRQAEHDVYGLERRPSDSANVIYGDIASPALSVGERAFECVFHLAARTPLERNAGKLRSVNVEGARNLWKAIDGRTDSFVYVSGLGIYGNARGTIDDSTPYNPDTEFARQRLEAQRYLAEQCKKAGVRFTVAVLGDVYGPGGWFRNIIVKKMMEGNMFLMPGGGKYQKALLSVDDAAGSVCAIYEDGLRQGSYVVASPEEATFREFLEYAATLLKVGRPRAIPAFAARMALGSDLVKLLCTPTSVSAGAISEIYRLEYPGFREGLDHTMSQMRNG